MTEDTNDNTRLSAQNTDNIEEAPNPNGPAHPSTTDGTGSEEETPAEDTRTYQDDLDADDNATDPFTDEATDDPTELLQVPADEYKDEMDGIAFDESSTSDDDMRETIEDRDEADDSSAAGA